MVRYYEREHLDGYARIKGEGLSQWSDLHERLDGFGDFPNRTFLDRVLPAVEGRHIDVFEYGCGTGPAACFLAARGYRVRGIDLVPDAIDIARRHAHDRGLSITFTVEDVCQWDDKTEQYDVVLDSYCLQSIVLDTDRARVLDGVRRRLRPGGRYMLSTAMFDPARDYGTDRFDPATGIVWAPTPEASDDAERIGNSWWVPNRRHRTVAALRAELGDHGFRVLEQSAAGGDFVCTTNPATNPAANSSTDPAPGP